jgi:hypothetical protein
MFDDVQENLSKLREKIENEDRIKSPVRLSKGDIVEMELDENDGITLDGQYETRRKYIVIIGVTSKGDIYGAYLINSKIPPFKNNDIMKGYQYILLKDDYPKLLMYDSFLDCTEFFPINKKKMIARKAKNRGALLEKDLNNILRLTKSSLFLSEDQKRKFRL